MEKSNFLTSQQAETSEGGSTTANELSGVPLTAKQCSDIMCCVSENLIKVRAISFNFISAANH